MSEGGMSYTHVTLRPTNSPPIYFTVKSCVCCCLVIIIVIIYCPPRGSVNVRTPPRGSDKLTSPTRCPWSWSDSTGGVSFRISCNARNAEPEVGIVGDLMLKV